MTGIGLPLNLRLPRPRLPMNAGIAVIVVVVAPSVRRTRTPGIEELREVIVGDRQSVDEKSRQRDAMRGPFIGWPFITAHDETASRNAQPRRRWLRCQRHAAWQTQD